MNSNSKLELIVGWIVFVFIIAFFVFFFKIGFFSQDTSLKYYRVTAKFDDISGLNINSKVTLAGLKIGKVIDIKLDRETYRSSVILELEQNYNNIPVDSIASVLTLGILGEKYIGISIGGSNEYLKDGSIIYDTQSSLILEDLVGKFILSFSEKLNK